MKVYTFRRQKKISDLLNRDATEEDIRTITDKNLFNETFSQYIKRDWYDATKPDKENAERFLNRNETFLVKPILSTCGKGIEFFRSAQLNHDEFLDALAGRAVILEGFISQNSELAQINSSSVNTIRLITAKCGDDVCVISGGLRCGGKDSITDNFHAGGCAYPIDVETGIIDMPGKKLGSQKRIIKHPSSQKVVCGFQIPNYEKIIETVTSAAKVMARVGYIGWDIAVLEDGCEIIEANVNYPGTNIIQLDGFTAYEKVRLFLKEHGY